MSNRPWMPLYVSDYLADTVDLKADESGVYLTMLMLTWRRHDAALPNDMEWLKRSLKACLAEFHGHQFNRIVPKLLDRYFTLDGGFYRNKRLTKERQKTDKLSANQSQKANKRWAKENDSNDLVDAGALPSQSQLQSQEGKTESRAQTRAGKRDAAGSPLDQLKLVLDPDRAEAVVNHRRCLRKPLSAYAARLLARKFAELSNPNEGADAMIANGWQGFDASWMRKGNGNGQRNDSAPRTELQLALDKARQFARSGDQRNVTVPEDELANRH